MLDQEQKRYSQLKGNNDADKKNERQEWFVVKRKLQFQDYKNCLEAGQIERKIKYLGKKTFNVDSRK